MRCLLEVRRRKGRQAQRRQGDRYRLGPDAVHPIGLGVGLIGGGLLGALHHKGLGLDRADRERIGSELQGGKAAVGVLAPVSDADIVADKLTQLGGAAETRTVSDEALEEAHTAVTADEA